jgi:hypothetical protein
VEAKQRFIHLLPAIFELTPGCISDGFDNNAAVRLVADPLAIFAVTAEYIQITYHCVMHRAQMQQMHFVGIPVRINTLTCLHQASRGIAVYKSKEFSWVSFIALKSGRLGMSCSCLSAMLVSCIYFWPIARIS